MRISDFLLKKLTKNKNRKKSKRKHKSKKGRIRNMHLLVSLKPEDKMPQKDFLIVAEKIAEYLVKRNLPDKFYQKISENEIVVQYFFKSAEGFRAKIAAYKIMEDSFDKDELKDLGFYVSDFRVFDSSKRNYFPASG